MQSHVGGHGRCGGSGETLPDRLASCPLSHGGPVLCGPVSSLGGDRGGHDAALVFDPEMRDLSARRRAGLRDLRYRIRRFALCKSGDTWGLQKRRPAGRRQHVSAAFQSAPCPNRLSLSVVSTTTQRRHSRRILTPRLASRVASLRRDVGMKRGFFNGQDRPGARGGHPGPCSRPRRFRPEGGALVRRLGAICTRHGVARSQYFWDAARGWIDAQRAMRKAVGPVERPRSRGAAG